MREKELEKKLVKAVKETGGWCVKFVSPGNAGVPDRLILLPGGRAMFAEIKAPGKKPRPLQEVLIRKLRNFGFLVFIIDEESQISKLVEVAEHART